jgi:hypothetical protein
MSKEQTRRIMQALAECGRVLDRATSYLPEHQDAALISLYQGHRTKLLEMLK